MRKTVLLYAAFFSAMLVAPCFASPPPVTNGLAGCWAFDEGGIVTAIDTSGNGNDGTMVNTAYAAPPPQSLSTASLRFNSTSAANAYSYVTIPDRPSLRLNSSLTLAAWVKANTIEQRSCGIICKQYGSGASDSFALWYQYATLRFTLTLQTSSPTISVAAPPANEWHHIVATYDGSYIRLYVDGVEKVNSTATGAILYDNNTVLIGADSDQASHTPDAGWNGFIDEVLVYNRALSQAEIAQVIPEFPPALILPFFMLMSLIMVVLYKRRPEKQADLVLS